MKQIGINLMVWSGQVGPETIDRFPRIKEWGYNGVEVPIFEPDTIDTSAVRSALAATGLRCTVSTALPEGLALIDETMRQASVSWLQKVIKTAAALGASVVCGPLAAPVGDLRGRGYITAEWESCVLAFKELGQVASEHGLTLALEPLNRFETFFVNTISDAVRLMDAVDQPAVGLLLDTFHMNIEEKSIPAAISQAGSHLKHFHCSENDRGTVGSGHIPWSNVFAALGAINYEGWLVIESFGAAIPELAAAACVWRPLAPSPEALAEESLHFIWRQLHTLRL